MPPGDRAGQPARHPAGEVRRRTVLKGLGAAGVSIFVAGAGVVGYRTFDNGILDSGSGRPYDAWDHWRSDPNPLGAVAAAVLAANPHNTQPWIFHIGGDRIEVFSDARRRMRQMDPLLREHHVGLGCSLENLLLAAAARGYQTKLALTPSPHDPAHVAGISLTPGTAATSPLYEVIGDRHSNRGPFTEVPVPIAMLDDLASHAEGLPGAEVHWLTSPADKAAMGTLIIDATQAVVDDQQQSMEGFSWFRNNRDDIDVHQDGLTLDGQGLDALTLAAAKLLPASSRATGDQFWLTQTRTVHTATAAAYGIITVADASDVSQRLTGGRLLQRVHLAATLQDLGLQHMNQVTERIDSDQAQHRPVAFKARLDQLTGQPGRQPLAAFRVGFPRRTARRSPRRPLAAVLQ